MIRQTCIWGRSRVVHAIGRNTKTYILCAVSLPSRHYPHARPRPPPRRAKVQRARPPPCPSSRPPCRRFLLWHRASPLPPFVAAAPNTLRQAKNSNRSRAISPPSHPPPPFVNGIGRPNWSRRSRQRRARRSTSDTPLLLAVSAFAVPAALRTLPQPLARRSTRLAPPLSAHRTAPSDTSRNTQAARAAACTFHAFTASPHPCNMVGRALSAEGFDRIVAHNSLGLLRRDNSRAARTNQPRFPRNDNLTKPCDEPPQLVCSARGLRRAPLCAHPPKVSEPVCFCEAMGGTPG